MADTVVTNQGATPLGLHDVDASHAVVGALGGSAIFEPDAISAQIIDIYAKAGMTSATTAAAPVNTVAPVASGDVEVGDTVSVTAGTWTGNPTPTLTYQWEVSDGDAWAEIEGATSNSLILTEDLVGEDVRCVVTATNGVGTESANSNPVGPVVAVAPVNAEAPVASGEVEVGSTVSVTTGVWTAKPPPSFTYQWQVTDSESWVDIDGETAATLELIEDFAGEEVRCVVTATNIAGTEDANSNALGPVTSAA
jgi:hypothetical protein